MPLDVIAAIFGGLLRRAGVAASPAEVIEVRRVLGLLGVGASQDLGTLRSALRATCVKYAHENHGFDAAFDALFHPAPPAVERDERIAQWAPNAEGLPTALDVEEDPEAAGRYAGYDERFAEVGDELDLPDAEGGFNPHRDDDDVSLTGAQHELSVSAEADQGRRGVTYTVEVDRASTTTVGALSDGSGSVAVGSLSWDDPESILAWLDAYDPSRVYGADADDLGPLTEAQLQRLSEAIESFVEALAARSALTAEPIAPVMDQDPHAQVELACHEILRRMRGAPRPRPREHGRGGLDMRRTVRASLRTEGVPFRLITRTPTPDRVRLLILADVSLSVRPITAFSLRLAQAMHRRAHRCQVLAFVDRPVDVTEVLLRGGGDDALARVLADEHIDLEASSDYGRVLDEMLSSQAGALNKRTAVLIVGDGRSNGLAPKADQLAALRRRVHRLAWITPEPSRYWGQATCAMDEYADICDRVITASDPEQLLAHAGELGHALS